MTDREPLVAIEGVVKEYRSLRPLRVQHLEIHADEIVALLGFDQGAAEVLVNLIAGATLPDSGEVRAFGRPTTAIADGDAWLKALDEFGIISERAVLLEQMTAEQNLAVPLTLDLEGMSDDLRERVRALADEAGIDRAELARFTSALSPLTRMRLRLARAIAVGPRLVMAEHPNASLPAADVSVFAADLRRIAAARELGLIVLTADERFAASMATRVLRLNAATGTLSPVRSGWRSWLRQGGG